VRRLVRRSDRLRDLDTGRDDPHVARAQLACRACQVFGRDNREPCPAEQRPEDPRRLPGQLDVRAPELDDVWLPGLERRQRGRQPVRVDEVGVPRRASRRPGVIEEEQRQQQREPRPPAQVAGDSVPVGDPVVPERRRRDDLDVDALRPHALDRIADEEAGHVLLAARVRGRQDDDPHVSRRENTIGAASARSAKAKK
jgi:hypothetical protein